MKITCDVKTLRDALQNVQRAVASKSSIEVLEGVLVRAKSQNELFICGYNLEIGITTNIGAQIEDPYGFVIDSKILTDILRKAESTDISIEVNDNLDTIVKSGKSRFSIKALPETDYPILPSVDSSSNVRIESGALKKMIKQTIFAASLLDERPVNTGTLFDIKDNLLTMVSVDNFRLAKTCTPLKTGSILENKFIVPAKTLSELVRLMPDEKEDDNIINNNKKNDDNDYSDNLKENIDVINVHVGEHHVVFSAFGYSIISRRIEGEFLDYDSAIPKTSSSSIRVNTREIINCIDRVSVLISERIKSPVRLKFTEDLVHFSCQTPLGESEDSLALNYTGEDFEIGLNSKYILDALKNADTDIVNLEFSGPLAPVKITPLDGNSFVFLVLPVRLVAD